MTSNEFVVPIAHPFRTVFLYILRVIDALRTGIHPTVNS